MRKLKVTLMAMAIVLGIGGAIASAPAPDCKKLDQYYDSGAGWIPAGVEGVDYICVSHWTKICTYIKTPNGYVPCKRGEIVWLQ